MGKIKNAQFWRSLGPGLLFSGAAVGVSHLVQSTRAGALFGAALIGTIILINTLKYPAFRFGVDYGQSTRKSLFAGYGELGRWAPILICLAVFPVAPIIVAAISATTAGLIGALTGTALSLPIMVALVIAGSAWLIIAGGYRWLDRVNRVLMAFLTLATLITTALVLPKVDWGTLSDTSWMAEPTSLLFVIALAGFMPNPLDVSIPQSIWSIEAEEGLPKAQQASLSESRSGFLTGYMMSALLALCFCIMGAGVMHGAGGAGVEPAKDAVGFAAQIIGLYRENLGEIPALAAALSALAVMFSTLFVAFDAYGKVCTAAYQQIAGQEDKTALRRAYIAIILTIAVLAFGALALLMADFGSLVDLATSLAFLSAPIIAALNHLVVTRCTMPEEARPSPAIRMLSLCAILVMSLLAICFFVL